MKPSSNKNTSVFLGEDLSRADAQRRGDGGTRFCETAIDRSTWKHVRLGEVCEITKGQQLNRATLAESGQIPVYNGGSAPSGYTEIANTKEDNVNWVAD